MYSNNDNFEREVSLNCCRNKPEEELTGAGSHQYKLGHCFFMVDHDATAGKAGTYAALASAAGSFINDSDPRHSNGNYRRYRCG